MSKHYEERYYVRDEIPGEYEEHRRSSSRRRSTSRTRHRAPPSANGGEEHYYRQRLDRSGSGSSISSMSDYEYRAQCVGERPLVRVPRDVIRAPTPPPVIQRVVERAPTPEPDIVERVIVRPQPQQLIERIIERPRTPPPKIIDKEICEPAPPPIVRTRIVKVDHSPRHYANSNPIRYVQAPRSGMGNYNQVTEYDYGGYDPSYSTSYSTTELFQPTSGYGPTYTSGYPQATHTQITYQPGSSGQGQQGPPPPPPQQQAQQQQQQPQQAQIIVQSQPNYVPSYNNAGAAAAYNPNYNTYGYRSAPMPQNGYNPNPMTQAGYPRQY